MLTECGDNDLSVILFEFFPLFSKKKIDQRTYKYTLSRITMIKRQQKALEKWKFHCCVCLFYLLLSSPVFRSIVCMCVCVCVRLYWCHACWYVEKKIWLENCSMWILNLMTHQKSKFQKQIAKRKRGKKIWWRKQLIRIHIFISRGSFWSHVSVRFPNSLPLY